MRWENSDETFHTHENDADLLGVTLLMLLAVWAANTWLLEDYYVRNKIGILERCYTQIDEILRENPLSEMEPYSEDNNADELSELIKTMGERYNTTIVLVDNVTGKAMVSSARDKAFLARRLFGYALDQYDEPVDLIKEHEDYVIQRSYNPIDRTADLEAWGSSRTAPPCLSWPCPSPASGRAWRSPTASCSWQAASTWRRAARRFTLPPGNSPSRCWSWPGSRRR